MGLSYNLVRDMGLSAGWLASSEAKSAQVDDPELPELRRQHMLQYGAQSILTVPLIAKDVVFGYAELWESRRRREFTANEISLCHSIAQQAAMALRMPACLKPSANSCAWRRPCRQSARC